MVIQVLILIAGFLLLVKGADWFVDGAASLAERWDSAAGGRSDDCCDGDQHAGSGSQYRVSSEK